MRRIYLAVLLAALSGCSWFKDNTVTGCSPRVVQVEKVGINTVEVLVLEAPGGNVDDEAGCLARASSTTGQEVQLGAMDHNPKSFELPLPAAGTSVTYSIYVVCGGCATEPDHVTVTQ